MNFVSNLSKLIICLCLYTSIEDKYIYFFMFTIYIYIYIYIHIHTTREAHTMTNITTRFVALYSPTGHPFKIRNHLIAHALLNFNVFLAVVFITPTNFHQFIRIQITFKTIFKLILLIFILDCCNSIVMVFIWRRIPQYTQRYTGFLVCNSILLVIKSCISPMVDFSDRNM